MRTERSTKSRKISAAKALKNVWSLNALRPLRPACLMVKQYKQMLFENKKRDVYTVNKHKIALNRDDDNRLVQANGITTLVRGYLAFLA